MRIGELAAATGTSQRLLRYYEERGLITPDRSANGYRDYPESAVRDVARIRRLLAAGLPVRVINDVLACVCGGDDDVEPCMEPTLRAELSALDGQLDDLRHRRAELNDLIGRIHADA
ncbi:MerR family transcriptional regulator [Nocardia puris]|uniref:DNA-binding transcriptional MerR regulator n=1 Tax=Nocardia puris TaxID=208602 RepID=A0A366DM38_9NOCA|nr:MerR family transcriptional regulator [Nocardia puris]MBF6213031.1 MerR family transcriptional regulator [Nocardia puris]MBF6368022.1 MerR family transcriptional regulator [Nocardia puris]MBF6462655.1 MerR family transcriptional regulator [Nocardia puris]RBO90278.1 DNA-binding transcriptional MerR regulator [Nocardia puris]